MKVTLIFAFVVLPLNLLITLPLAVMIESVARRLRPLLRTVFFMPVLTSAVAVAVIWQYVLNPQYGLLNAMIAKVTGARTVISWLNDPNLTVLGIPVALIAVTFAYLWMDIGYNLVIFIAALQGIPKSLNEAADARRGQRVAAVPAGHAAAAAADDPAGRDADDDLVVPGVRPVPGHDDSAARTTRPGCCRWTSTTTRSGSRRWAGQRLSRWCCWRSCCSSRCSSPRLLRTKWSY